MNELWARSALELAAMIRTGDTTSRSVVEAHLARIDSVNGDLNAIVRRLDDDALAAADAADAALARSEATGPLHGVPFTVKENIDLVGSPTTEGTVASAEAMPTSNAPVTARMLAAGAIPIGRTNLPDFGLRVHTDSSLHGLTRNPHHPGRTAGGSSGGEASAIASGMSPLGLGNDIGGSLRNPAHCCGIASIKPSIGVVASASSLAPGDPMLSSQQMAVQGTMARRVADVRASFEVVAGADPRDPTSLPVTLTSLGDGERLRVAVLADPPGGATHPEIAAAVRSAADVLSDAGHDVVEATPPMYEETIEMWAALLIQDLIVMRPMLEMVMGADATAIVANLLAGGAPVTVESMVMLQAHRSQAMRQWSEFFTEHPVMLSPTWAMPAFEHGADLVNGDTLIRDTLRPVTPINFLGLPAAVVPHAKADGLPVGVQVIGDRFTDLRCLDVAAQIEAASPPLMPIDPVTA
ncbi:MAG: amidase [Ilumatobacter sp.]|uniref:amidase n=1 Tax=Ilumatobacter sp. TaxID=1967498 RepID=UPI00329707AD